MSTSRVPSPDHSSSSSEDENYSQDLIRLFMGVLNDDDDDDGDQAERTSYESESMYLNV